MATPGGTGPSRAWFIVPAILMTAALALAGFGLVSFLHFARSDLRAYEPGSSISVNGDGFTLYVQEGISTGPADLRCTASRPGAQVRLQPISGHVSWSNGEGSFVAIASTPPDLPPGRYAISCVSVFGASAPLYLGPRLDLGAVARLVVFNIITPLVLGVCAAVLFAILVVLRCRTPRKRPPDTPAAMA